MSRIFTILSVLAVFLIVLAGFSAYWFSLPDIRQAKQKTTSALASGISLAISSRLNTLQDSVDKLAQMPEVIEAFEQDNRNELRLLSKRLATLLPDTLNLRLLPPHVSELDQSSTPHMGYADLEMVQATLKGKQAPTVQGEGEHRHLAITSLVSKDGKAIGVLLASMKYDFINATVNGAGISEGMFELKQQRTILSSAGDPQVKTAQAQELRIPHSSWIILYWPEQQAGVSELTLILATIALCGLSACLAFFIGYRKLSDYLRQDQASIFKVTKDLVSGKMAGNYPVQLHEMKSIISTLVQYKRVLDQQDNEAPETKKEFEDDFFDEGLDTSFLDTPGIDTSESKPVKIKVEEAPASKLQKKPAPAPATAMPSVLKSQPNTENIFRAYDIRGVVDKSLTPEIVFKIGQALASEAKQQGVKTIVVGRDGRKSSQALATSLMQGIIATGLDVLDIGLIPTPVLYFVAHHSDGRSGAMITGSHNPAEYNGIKMMLKGETLAGKKIQALKQRIENNDFATGASGSIEQNTLFTNEYIGIISEDIHIVRPMKVVLDCGNGAAAELAPILLKTLGCELIELFCEIDGSFPNHHPDPSKPENLQDLITAVKRHEADVGIALDGDGDRLGVVDSSGKIIWPDRQMMLFAKDVLASKPATEVIFDVKCSRHLGDQIIKYGGRPLMWKTGHSLIKAKLKETGASLAGEMSGHIFFNDRWFGFDDGLYAAARVIEILSADTRSSSEVFASLPDSVNTPEITIAMPEGENIRFVEQLSSTAKFPNANVLNIDGIRVEFEDGWGLIRASNTTPSLVARFEADDQQALKRIQEQFKQLLLSLKPDLSLPF
ncbi:phosphomannomutase/phosphoglucomutase [Methylomarinum vadi]|uniref:phosphomannomutase/phosphoglucomutase n=1 Tax=Methylomarinum vadi TaxID=438855 RepID=UPI0004DFBAF7|nr:phosphomannomutase/phosphoglucomutase [Methylomarinum vadi]